MAEVRVSNNEVESLLEKGSIYLGDADSDSGVILSLYGHELPRISYWGHSLDSLPDARDLRMAQEPQRVSGALDRTAWPSILPTQSEAWTGARRLIVQRDGSELFCHSTTNSVVVDKDSETPSVRVSASDSENSVELEWVLQMLPGGLLRQRAGVKNTDSGAELAVSHVELGFPVPADCVQLQSFTGHHLRERAAQEQAFTVGRFEKQSVVGRPDFDASTLLTAGRAGMGFETGESFSVHVGWSGNSVVSAEKTPYTQGILGGGEILFGGEVSLGEGETYRTPWVYGSFGNGLDQAAGRFHEYLRSVHPRLRKIPRPVILNTWEAVYFNQSEKKLMALADVASKCGIERFVVDDGWFDGRRDDTTSLGDWQTDKTVWPQGLKPLADHVHSLGMQFGLWFEPEMISLNSKIARLHPEWIVKPSRNRLPMQGRHQQVLDLTNPAAYKYVYDAMAMLVDELSIDYIKWDHNRFVTEAVSPQNGRPCVHKQTLAVYSLFSQLKESFPELEIETCSSGGGRIDMGILALADRVWVSDCVDPVERIDIQRYTSLLVPPEMMGDHIGASPAHSTGRATSLQMRAATAFFGHLGVEWDLTKVSNDDLVALRQWVDEYKLRRDLFASGRLVHADTADPAVRVDGMVSHDKKTAIFRFTQLTTSTAYPAAFVRLPGLDATSLYEVRPLKINQGLEEIGNGQSELQWWNEKGVVLPGGVLASFGIRPPQLNPEEAVLFEVNEKAAR